MTYAEALAKAPSYSSKRKAMSSFSVFSSNAIGSCLEYCRAGSILDRFFPSDLMEDSAHYVLVLLLGSLDVTHIEKQHMVGLYYRI